MPPLAAELRKEIRQRAQYRCEYCQTDERLTGIACEIDHIRPLAAGGTDAPENLCLACPTCNSHKWAKTEGIDPETQQLVRLYHPRQQNWPEHFAWGEGGHYLIGLTPCGRATIEALNMNHVLITTARQMWAQFGKHPPQ